MNKESLEILKETLHKYVYHPDIPIYDKVELMINIYHFLDNYKENIQVLEQYRLKKKKEDTK